MIAKNIIIGYYKSNTSSFMSNIVFMDNFLGALSHYTQVITTAVSTGSYFQNFRSIHDPHLDYLIVDVKDFGLQQFLLREKYKVNLPFIVILHTIFSWTAELVYMIPLIKKEDIIIAPSEFAKGVFLKMTSHINVHVIAHCLDINAIERAKNGQGKHHGKSIVYMGRLVKEKGVEELVECLPQIKKAVNGVHLNIIGPLSGSEISEHSKEPFVKKLETKIRALGLSKAVSFMGFKKGREKFRLLSNNDVFVFPTTLEEENAPVSLLEALACGLPVITTDWAANSEVIKDGYNGFLLPVRYKKTEWFNVDKKTLASLVVKILKDKKLRARLQKKALMTASEYDHGNVIPVLLKELTKRTGDMKFHGWKVLKNKKIVDFKGLFSRDFLFFIYYDSDSFLTTYGSLITTKKRFFSQRAVERKKAMRTAGERNVLVSSQKSNESIKRDLWLFLLKS